MGIYKDFEGSINVGKKKYKVTFTELRLLALGTFLDNLMKGTATEDHFNSAAFTLSCICPKLPGVEYNPITKKGNISIRAEVLGSIVEQLRNIWSPYEDSVILQSEIEKPEPIVEILEDDLGKTDTETEVEQLRKRLADLGG